jgi:hypothetical protein
VVSSLQAFQSKFCTHLVSAMRATCSSHLTLLDLIDHPNKMWGVQNYGAPHCAIFSSLLLLLLLSYD